jgi:hypothetical protein
MNTAAKMRNAIIGLILAASLVACDTPVTQANISKLSLGMTKQEVIAKLGPPSSISTKKDAEYLVYKLAHGSSESGAQACAGFGILTPVLEYIAPACHSGGEKDFFVHLTNGKVASYGEVGDFDD